MAAQTPLREFRLDRRVQFYETDAAGIVHFSWYPRYMEEAEHAMWRAAGLSIHAPEDAYGWPRVALTVDYLVPLHFEDEFTITIWVAELGARSMRYGCDLSRGDTRVATGSMTTACVTRDAEGAVRSTPLPGIVRERFAVSEARR